MKRNKKFILHEIKPDGSLKEIFINLSIDASHNISDLPLLIKVSKDFYEIVDEQQKRIDELTIKLNKIINFLK